MQAEHLRQTNVWERTAEHAREDACLGCWRLVVCELAIGRDGIGHFILGTLVSLQASEGPKRAKSYGLCQCRIKGKNEKVEISLQFYKRLLLLGLEML